MIRVKPIDDFVSAWHRPSGRCSNQEGWWWSFDSDMQDRFHNNAIYSSYHSGGGGGGLSPGNFGNSGGGSGNFHHPGLFCCLYIRKLNYHVIPTLRYFFKTCLLLKFWVFFYFSIRTEYMFGWAKKNSFRLEILKWIRICVTQVCVNQKVSLQSTIFAIFASNPKVFLWKWRKTA